MIQGKRKLRVTFLTGVLCLLLAGLAMGAAAKEITVSQFYTYAEPGNTATQIFAMASDETTCLVLPSGTDVTQLPLYFTLSEPNAAVSVSGGASATGLQSGQTLDLPALCGGVHTEYKLILRTKSGADSSVQTIVIRVTQGVGALFLTSDDPQNQGRQWVEASADKTNKATGSCFMQDADGTTVYSGRLKQIKGRGNSTWKGAKKPYQIKLESKADLLQTGDAANRAKTWVLLANYFDLSLLRNSIALDLAGAMQMEPTVQYTPVSLYYDGEYRGAYQLSEKVEIGSGRVAIADLEAENEACNEALGSLAALPTAQGLTDNGATYIYTTGMSDPTDISGGYLLEMDFATRAQEEQNYFVTKRGYYIVVKSPECCSKAEMDYIASYYQDYEDTVFSGGLHPTNGRSLQSYIDLTSVAQCYIINELSKNPDGFHTSTYLYKDAGEDRLHMGPIWDYDLSFGTGTGANNAVCAEPTGFFVLYDSFVRALYANADFRMAVKQVYTQVTAPLVNQLCGKTQSATGTMRTLADYTTQLQASAAADRLLWNEDRLYTAQHPGGTTWNSQVAFLQAYLQARNTWLLEAFSAWQEDVYAPLGSYVDVADEAWYKEAVEAVTAYGLMTGQGNGVFSPEEETTRAQTAQVLYAMSGVVRPTVTQIFTDVAPAMWYAASIQWAYQNQIVAGYPDGTFRPDESISRQDMVVLLYRNAGSPTVSGTQLQAFQDSASIGSYARAAMVWAMENQLVSGYPDGTVRPLNPITRAEFATILQLYYENQRG